MIRASEVSCVVVTRGNVDLTEVKASLPFEDVGYLGQLQLAADDLDEKVYGRYASGSRLPSTSVIVVQDDDNVGRGLSKRSSWLAGTGRRDLQYGGKATSVTTSR